MTVLDGEARRTRLAAARLYLILTPQICPRPPQEVLREALDGGVQLVQLRDKEAGDREFAERATALREVCHARGVPLILNDRVHLVEDTDADGVHVGEDDPAPEEARAVLGPDRLVGWSTHNRTEVEWAAGRGVDSIGLGPIFRTATRPSERRPGGAALIESVRDAARMPLFPIGGIRPGNLPALIRWGAFRAAVGSAICAAEDPRAIASELRKLLDRAARAI